MSREVRITVDDDEVFERMKRRKRELDLSWEEVLHRGLRREPEPTEPEPEPERGPRGPGPRHSPEPPRGPGQGHGHGPERGARGGRDVDSWGEVVEGFNRQIKDHVVRSVESSLRDVGDEFAGFEGLGGDLGAEVGALESAEDAELVFEFLDDRPAHRVPLRVNLRTSRSGLDVEVVTVRQGKSVRDRNRFEQAGRREINAHLARGEPATLRFTEGVEEYGVLPVLSWSREEDGRPTVAAVEIDEVLLDDE